MTTATPKYTNDELEELTETLHLLSSPRRVHVLEALRGEDSLQRTELVTRVTESMNPGERPSGQARKRNGISLLQVHLPSLKKACLITWNKQTDEISPGDRYEDAIAVLDAALETHHS